MIKLGNIARFRKFPSGMALNLPSTQTRKVRLDVNCEAQARFDVVSPDGEPVFLAQVEGPHTIEFVWTGPCLVLATSEGEVWLADDEGPHLVYETDEDSFVTLDFERQELTQFERMQAIANLKREQRERETEELLAELRAERKAIEEAKNEGAKEKPANSPEGGAAEQKSANPADGSAGEAAASGDGKSKPDGEGAS